MKLKLKSPKVISLKKAIEIRKKIRNEKKVLVLTNGVFDILHPGHIYYLNMAKNLSNGNGYLFVAVNSDSSVKKLKGKSRPILDQEFRTYSLANLNPVDAVIIFKGKRLAKEILALNPDIYCKAGDYKLETLEQSERRALEKVKAQIIFLPFVDGLSTTNIINKIKANIDN